MKLHVARRTVEADGICSFELVDPAGAPLPPFSAGAHLDVTVPDGPTRPYSLCNDPTERHRYLIAVLREPASRGGSSGLHERVREGQLLDVGLPRNQFPLAGDARRHLLLAGGIGITPILGMAEHLSGVAADFELHYTARSRSRMAFVEHISRSRFAARAHLHLDDGPTAQRLDLPAVLADASPDRHLYVCGPRGFIEHVLATAGAAGWTAAQLHREHFDAAPRDGGGAGAFEVMLASCGRVIPVGAQQSIVQALAAAGIEVPTSCEQGICGTCLTRVIDGTPEHRDSYLTPEEQAANDQLLPCCSRARSPRLVLDL